MTGKYYWFQKDYFVMAVDAINISDARAWIKLRYPTAVYKGLFSADSFPKTACGCITDKRQVEITNKLSNDW